MFFVFFEFISRPTSVVALRSVSVFTFIVFVVTDQKLVCPIQFLTALIFLDSSAFTSTILRAS